MKNKILQLAFTILLSSIFIGLFPSIPFALASGLLHHLVITHDGTLTWEAGGNNLPGPTYGHQAVVWRNYLYILGGTNNSRIHRTVLSLTQPGLHQSWNSSDLLPQDIMYFQAAAADENRIYLIGGSNGTAATNTVYYTSPESTDGSIITWTKNSTYLPTFVQQHQSFIHNGYIYSAGGISSASGSAKETVLVGKINTNGSISSFSATTSLPIKLLDHRMIVIGDRVYLVGGFIKEGTETVPSAHVYSTTFEADGDLHYPWREEATLPQALYRHSLGFFGSRLYVFGGMNSLDTTQRTVYFAELGEFGEITSWEQDETFLPYSVAFHQTIQHNSNFYLLGGDTETGSSANVFYSQDVIENQEKDVYFPITITGMDEYGQIYFDYRSNTNLDVYKAGFTFYISPELVGVGKFALGSAQENVKIWPAGSAIKMLARQEGTWGVAGESNSFSVENKEPELISVSPDFGYNNVPVTVEIMGNNFYQDNDTLPILQLGPVFLQNIELISSTHLRAVVPVGMRPGDYALVITNPDGKSTTLLSAYEVVDASASAVFTINHGEYATNNLSVTLSMAAENPPNATVHLMRFSNDGIYYTDWEAYTSEKIWQLQNGLDGVRIVYVEFKDTLGNTTGIFSDSIIYDTTLPVVDYDNIEQLPDSPEDSPTIVGTITDTGSGIASIIWEIWKTNGYELIGEQPVVAGSASYFNPEFQFTVPISLIPSMYRVHVIAYDRAGNRGDNIDHPMVFTVTGIGNPTHSMGSITGVVTNFNQGIGDVYVYVYAASDHDTLVRLSKTSQVIPGYYFIDDLATGLYKVGFQGGPLSQEWFYGYTNSFANAKVIEVTAPWNSDNINFEITKAEPTSATLTATATNYTPVFSYTPTPTGSRTATPSGTKVIVINSDAVSANATLVDLHFNPPTTYSWDTMWLSNNNSSFIEKTYTVDYDNWELEHATSGEKKVYVIFEDSTGHQSATFSDSIYYNPSGATPIPTSAHEVNRFWAEYYNNSMLFGTPVVTQLEEMIYYDWGSNSPLYPVYSSSKDYFSIRWAGDFDFAQEGNYIFRAYADDGVRVWVDGDLVIDAWQLQPAKEFLAMKGLESGRHTIKMEYFEYSGAAVAKLEWEFSGNGVSNQFVGQYYDNSYLLGRPVVTQYDSAINFDWQYTSPFNGEVRDAFSVRWIGNMEFPEDSDYTFKARCDDGCRVWVDDYFIINEWHPQPPTVYEKGIFLTQGIHRVWMEYQEIGGLAVAELKWSQQ